MGQYRKRPIIVEANQWHSSRKDGPTPTPPGVYYDNGYNIFYVTTINGDSIKIEPGDWVIVESEQPIKGFVHAYPCKPDIFTATYELVESDPAS